MCGLLVIVLVGVPPFYLYRVFVPNCIESIQFVGKFSVTILSFFILYTILFVICAAVFSVLVAIY